MTEQRLQSENFFVGERVLITETTPTPQEFYGLYATILAITPYDYFLLGDINGKGNETLKVSKDGIEHTATSAHLLDFIQKLTLVVARQNEEIATLNAALNDLGEQKGATQNDS